jgi:hypothetical protein
MPGFMAWLGRCNFFARSGRNDVRLNPLMIEGKRTEEIAEGIGVSRDHQRRMGVRKRIR